jgi:hypothetical protein
MCSLIKYELNVFSDETLFNCLQVYKSIDSKVIEKELINI